MKKLYLSLTVLILLFGFTTQAQNLVPNPSFEDTVSCPYVGDINDAKFWVNPTSYSPDYYNECIISSGPGDGFSVPNNWYGVQTARTGGAYAGIITFFDPDGREYIQAKLVDTLEAGKKYRVRFFVSLADSIPLAANDIGAYFSSTPISGASSAPLPFSPQIANNPVANPLTYKNTWAEVTDTFYATGSELYITIGNFKEDANTDTITVGGGTTQYSYYFIDDVSVVLDTGVGIEEIDLLSQFKLFPQPAQDYVILSHSSINLKQALAKISLLNMFGQEIILKNISVVNEGYRIDLTGVPIGIYIIKIISENQSSKSIKIIKN